MIIKSYLAYPVTGQKQALVAALQQIPQCEITPSTNKDLIVIVTESADETAEQALEQQLHAIPSLLSLTLVSGHQEDI